MPLLIIIGILLVYLIIHIRETGFNSDTLAKIIHTHDLFSKFFGHLCQLQLLVISMHFHDLHPLLSGKNFRAIMG